MAKHRSTRQTVPTPLYFGLETSIREAIARGVYKPGDCIPSERALGEEYGVSRITVRKALLILVEEGLLRRTRGRGGGSFVRRVPNTRARPTIGMLDRVSSSEEVNRIRVLRFAMEPADTRVAGMLGLAPGTLVRHVERIMSTASGPLSFVCNFIPGEAGQNLSRASLSGKFIKHILQTDFGLEIAHVRDEVEAAGANGTISKLLHVSAGSPVLHIVRTFTDVSRCPIYISELTLSGLCRLAVTLPEDILVASTR